MRRSSFVELFTGKAYKWGIIYILLSADHVLLMKRRAIFNPPSTEYTALQDIGKFNMLWHVSLGLIGVFTVLFGIHIYFQDSNWSTSLAALAVSIMNILVLQQTRKFWMVGVWSVVLGTMICQASIYIIDDSHLITDTMWCILVSFFTFFLFGSLRGSIVLLLNLGGLVCYLMLSDEKMLSTKGLTSEQVDMRMLVNVLYVALALSFIIHKMIENNKEVISRYELQTKQNDILLKEIHHRVKNNLQIVSSLLKLQAAQNTNSGVSEQFNEAISRVRSMALIHEKMYINEDFSALDVQSYVIALVEDITQSMESDCKIDLRIDAEMQKVDIKSIVPLSLIFNELITNSVRHGFEGLEKATIEINIERAGDKVLLYYSDNGTWKVPTRNNGFGVELINTLTEQLHGRYERTTEGGTHYRFVLDADQFFFTPMMRSRTR
ncbi:MAG: hypothetical protein A3D92_00780 [Bacteroidetes bacterium RIFCSPHIGHO2_02_FULL_44_7]|nr:MAG: hypothetical protein A3D92_00780 [Bacteroidetes bacterium RIFCSPHIGHO2_02_FULL_44_7]